VLTVSGVLFVVCGVGGVGGVEEKMTKEMTLAKFSDIVEAYRLGIKLKEKKSVSTFQVIIEHPLNKGISIEQIEGIMDIGLYEQDITFNTRPWQRWALSTPKRWLVL
jgi:hypothetical protein